MGDEEATATDIVPTASGRCSSPTIELKKVGKSWKIKVNGQYIHVPANTFSPTEHIEVDGSYILTESACFQIKLDSSGNWRCHRSKELSFEDNTTEEATAAEEGIETGSTAFDSLHADTTGRKSTNVETSSDWHVSMVNIDCGSDDAVPIRESTNVQTSSDWYVSMGDIDFVPDDFMASKKPSSCSDNPILKKKTASLPSPGTTPKVTHTMATEATRSYIYFEGLNPNMSGECLMNFIEAVGAVDVPTDQVVFSRDSTRAIVVVKGQIVVKDIEGRVNRRGLEGYKPSVSTIDPPDCIAVSSEEEIQNPGSMFLYFESKKSGGGEVRTDDVLEANDGSCYIIQFMEHAVVERLCSRSDPHEWNHTKLRVSPCYKSPQGYMWDTKLHTVPIPTPVDVTLPHTHVQYLTKCHDLEQFLLQEYVRLSPGADRTTIQLVCALTQDLTQFESRVRSWTDGARKHLQSYVDRHISEKTFQCVSKDPEKHNDEVWKRVTSFCEKEVTQEPKVVVDYDKSARKITLVGSEEIVRKKYERLQEKLTEVDNELRRTKEWRKLKSKEHVALLTRMESFKAVGMENVDVNIETSGVRVGVEGVPEDIAAVFCKILELSGTIICNKRVTAMSNDLVDLIEGSDTLKQTLSDAIEDTGVIAEWKVKSSDESNAEIEVWIEGTGESDVVADVIIGSVKETMVKYEKADDYLLQEQAWKDLRKEHSKLKPVLHFAFGSRFQPGIRVMGLKEHVDKAEQKLKKFFEENGLRKELVQCGTIEIKFLEKFYKAYLSDVQNQLQQYKVKLDIRGTETVSICGTRQGLLKARKELKQKFDSIIYERFSLVKVAIQQVYNTERDRGTIGTVETLTSCLIRREENQETHDPMTEQASTSQSGNLLSFIGCGGGENKSPSAAADQNQKQRDNLSSLHVVIYSDKKDNIKRCKAELEKQLEREYISKPIDDHKYLVKSLSKEEEGKLLPRDCIVDLVVDKPSGIIKISGPIQNVINARDHAQSVLRSIPKHREQVKNADILYEQVQWCYEEATPTERKRKPYDKLSNFLIEMAYENNDKQKVLVGSDGSKIVIDFMSLQKYPQDDPTDTVTVIRTDIVKSKMRREPRTWAPMKEDENIRKVNVHCTSEEYTDLATRFVKEVQTGAYSSRITWNKSNLKVTKIERIQNKILYQQYESKKEVITTEKQATMPSNMPIERVLWHGTTPEAVDSIIKHGFNRSYCGTNGIWFGAGVYFAGDASYSARGWLTSGNSRTPVTSPFSGQMFLAKAVTGRIVKGNQSMRYLPAINSAKPLVLYDSAVDNEQDPIEFVIFNDTQAYPAYLLSFSA